MHSINIYTPNFKVGDAEFEIVIPIHHPIIFHWFCKFPLPLLARCIFGTETGNPIQLKITNIPGFVISLCFSFLVQHIIFHI